MESSWSTSLHIWLSHANQSQHWKSVHKHAQHAFQFRHSHLYRQLTWINFCYLVAPIFLGEFRLFFTNKHGLKKIPRTANCPKNMHVKNEVILWPLTSSKIIVLVAQLISTKVYDPIFHMQILWAICSSGNFFQPMFISENYPIFASEDWGLGRIGTKSWFMRLM